MKFEPGTYPEALYCERADEEGWAHPGSKLENYRSQSPIKLMLYRAVGEIEVTFPEPIIVPANLVDTGK